ncbi:MAG: glycosyltransferase family 4 protein [Verrucomicrobiota bacterium]|nr:glycosyltransferase family 4 protein [Verrucomicrobiota bacterium]
MVLLIGNYPADQQQSMQRFAMMMLRGLSAAGVPAELIQPQPLLGRITFAGAFATKWLGYLDKFLFFPGQLKRKLAAGAALVHICDHSNAMYSGRVENRPVVVTCHDLLAVRGALGEATDCPASPTGKYLQRWIVSGLRKANAVACASPATLRDAQRIVGERAEGPELSLIWHGINHPYQKQKPESARTLLARVDGLDLDRPFALHVGSNLRMKNREGVLRIFALTKDQWNGQLVFAGQKLTSELRSLGERLGILDRVVEVEGPDNEFLEALYSSALVLLYPSRFEGFGWPIIEAQTCGCPVICSDREPMSDVGGEAALTSKVDDEPAMARSLLRLTDPVERASWSEKSLRNADRFRAEAMIAQYIELYRSLGAQV